MEKSVVWVYLLVGILFTVLYLPEYYRLTIDCISANEETQVCVATTVVTSSVMAVLWPMYFVKVQN